MAYQKVNNAVYYSLINLVGNIETKFRRRKIKSIQGAIFASL